MGSHVKSPWSSVGTLWSLLWRAVVMTPFAMVMGGLWLMTWPLLVILPVCEVFHVLARDWFWALMVPLIWVLVFLFARSRWFRATRCDFPNQQENV